MKDNLLQVESPLTRNPPYDFIDLKWDTIALSLKDLDLPMPETLQISRWQKSKVRKMFSSNNSYFRIVAHNPNTKKVRPVTDAYNLQDETLSENFLDLDEEQSVAVVQAVVQPTQLEVIVTDDQHTMTFNNEQVHICEQVQIEVPKTK